MRRGVASRVGHLNEVHDLEDGTGTSSRELNEAFGGGETGEGEHKLVHLAIDVESGDVGVHILEVKHNFGPVPGHVGLGHELAERVERTDVSSQTSEAGAGTLGSGLIHKSLEKSKSETDTSINLRGFLLSGELVVVMTGMEVVVVVKLGEPESFSLGSNSEVGLVSIS